MFPLEHVSVDRVEYLVFAFRFQAGPDVFVGELRGVASVRDDVPCVYVSGKD